jgi:hypothetical protein
LTVGQRYNRAGQSATKTPFAGRLGAIYSTFQRFKLAKFDRALITGPGHCSTEQTQCDFGRQVGKTARLDTKRAWG